MKRITLTLVAVLCTVLVPAAQQPTARPPAVPAAPAPRQAAPAKPAVQANAPAKAEAKDPQSAAAAYYLGYTCYKMGEPSRRMNADKEKAKELFARAFSLDPAFRPTWGR